MDRAEILFSESEGFATESAGLLNEIGHVTLGNLDRPALLRALPSADVLWVRLRHFIDREVLDAGSKLRFIVSGSTGLNHIDLEEAACRNITVLSLRGEVEFLRNCHATVEHTIALTLALLRKLPAATQNALSGNWDRYLFKGTELSGKTCGIIGYGRLGRMVARLLHAFGAKVSAFDPHVPASELEQPVEAVTLNELLEKSDLIFLHVNLAQSTVGMLDRDHFARIKPGASLINTARGELLDETALLDALESGRLRGAALDVISGEQQGLTDHPLIRYARTHSNLILTPHIGGCTYESIAKTERFMAEKLVKAWRKLASGR